MKKACKNCQKLTEENVCPVCGSTELSNRWTGLVIIINTESEIAKKLNITVPGEYALKVQG
jgi:DNA-directed RNA polymerase subunit E"